MSRGAGPQRPAEDDGEQGTWASHLGLPLEPVPAFSTPCTDMPQRLSLERSFQQGGWQKTCGGLSPAPLCSATSPRLLTRLTSVLCDTGSLQKAFTLYLLKVSFRMSACRTGMQVTHPWAAEEMHVGNVFPRCPVHCFTSRVTHTRPAGPLALSVISVLSI